MDDEPTQPPVEDGEEQTQIDQPPEREGDDGEDKSGLRKWVERHAGKIKDLLIRAKNSRKEPKPILEEVARLDEEPDGAPWLDQEEQVEARVQEIEGESVDKDSTSEESAQDLSWIKEDLEKNKLAQPDKVAESVSRWVLEVRRTLPNLTNDSLLKINGLFFYLYKQTLGHPDYAKLQETITQLDGLAQEIQQAAKEIEISLPFGLNSPEEYMKKSLQEQRAVIEKAFAPGNWMAHAGYLTDVPKLLESGGMRSSYGQEQYNKQVNVGERWRGARNPDRNAIYFYEGRNPNAGRYASADRGPTDLAIFYPSESVVKYVKAIGIKNVGMGLEFYVTSSPESVRQRELVDTPDDDTLLPWKEGYYVTSVTQKQKIREVFRKQGADETWIDKHVITMGLPPRDESEYAFHRAMDRNKGELLKLLDKNRGEVSAEKPRLRYCGDLLFENVIEANNGV